MCKTKHGKTNWYLLWLKRINLQGWQPSGTFHNLFSIKNSNLNFVFQSTDTSLKAFFLFLFKISLYAQLKNYGILLLMFWLMSFLVMMMMMRMLLLLNFVVAVPVLGEIAVFVIVFVAIAVIFAVDDVLFMIITLLLPIFISMLFLLLMLTLLFWMISCTNMSILELFSSPWFG